jgi:hypothetical protein
MSTGATDGGFAAGVLAWDIGIGHRGIVDVV